MIVAIAETGEYEQRRETLLGVFDDVPTAEHQLTLAISRQASDWAAFEAWKARRDAYLKTLKPTSVMVSSIFADGEYRAYREDQHAAAKIAAGDEPPIGLCADEVHLYLVAFGALHTQGWEKVKTIEIPK